MRRLHTILILIGFRLRANAPERQKRFPISISYQVRAELYRTVQRPGRCGPRPVWFPGHRSGHVRCIARRQASLVAILEATDESTICSDGSRGSVFRHPGFGRRVCRPLSKLGERQDHVQCQRRWNHRRYGCSAGGVECGRHRRKIRRRLSAGGHVQITATLKQTAEKVRQLRRPGSGDNQDTLGRPCRRLDVLGKWRELLPLGTNHLGRGQHRRHRRCAQMGPASRPATPRP